MTKDILIEYEKMDDRIEVRLTKSEKKAIRKYAAKSQHKTLSSYARDRLLHPVMFIENPAPYAKISYELNRIGTNINQVARRVNTHDEVTKNDVQELNKLRSELNKNSAWISKEFDTNGND